jgi:hypothetical protein
MKYYVSITETLNRVVGVEAESEKDAVRKVTAAYNNDEIELDSSYFVGEEIKLEDDQDAWRELDKDGYYDFKPF